MADKKKSEKEKPKSPTVIAKSTEVQKEDEKQEANLPATTTQKPDISGEKEVDLELVDEAYEKLEGIVKKHIVLAMLEAGQYLIKKFYDNNYDNARVNKKTKVKSLSELIRKINKEAGGTPSKTWIYDAVKLAVDDKDYNSNPDYQKIVHSNKVVLTHVQKEDMKKKLIKETAEKGYSVEKLKERIRELKGTLTLTELPPEEELKKRGKEELFTLQSQINWRYDKITETLEKYTKSKNRIDNVIQELGYVKEENKVK